MPTVKLLARIGGIFETWSKQKQSVFFHEFNFHSDRVGGWCHFGRYLNLQDIDGSQLILQWRDVRDPRDDRFFAPDRLGQRPLGQNIRSE